MLARLRARRMPKCEIRKSSAPVGGERNTRQCYTKIYDTHSTPRRTRALPSTLARRTRASAVLASGGYRSCGLERLQRVDSDTLAGTHKDSLHTRLVHFEGTNFTVTAASPTTTPLPPPKTANEKLVQIALMERRRANGVIARAIGERSPCAAARSRHGRCACAPRRAPTPAPCSEPAQRNRRNRRSSMQ